MIVCLRRSFLVAFFAQLEEHGVRYCLLRNYDDPYGDTSTDLDMLVSSYSLERFVQCLRQSAEQTGFHFVHTARYVNFSQVYWHPEAGFVRVDFETDVRWRLFTVLEAREVLDRCRRHQEFFIPHPEHEIVILLVAALWRGELTERYRQQLDRLYAECADKDSLRETTIAAFGQAGHVLAQFGERESPFDRRFFTWLRLSLALRTHILWPRFSTVLRNARIDASRYFERIFRSAGVSLLFVSSHRQLPDFAELMQRINFLFPIQKCLMDRTPNGGQAKSGRLLWKRLNTMIKGGLHLHVVEATADADLGRAVRTNLPGSYQSRSFLCLQDQTNRWCFAHLKTGFMATPQGQTDFSQAFIRFVSRVLERGQEGGAAAARSGRFAVLVGLDGSGKTTLARHLACRVLDAGHFTGMRYFHWLPSLFSAPEFPLSEPGNQPRRLATGKSAIHAALSVLRLTKNLLRARLAWRWRVRPLLRAGRLVLVDRYFYNYLLDPVSVNYSGPNWALRMLTPLFPPPDAVIRLQAPAAILLKRKQELSEAEVERQAAVLSELRFPYSHVVELDATLPAEELAEQVLRALAVNVSASPAKP